MKFDRSVAQFVGAGVFVAEPEVELSNRLSLEITLRINAVSNGIDCDQFGPTLYLAEDTQDIAKPCINALTEDQATFRGARARQWAQDQYS